jgi:O-methyltransferase
MLKTIKTALKRVVLSKLGSKVLQRASSLYLHGSGGYAIFPSHLNSDKALSVIRAIKGENEMLLSDLEALQIYVTALKTEKIPGEIAEVGVYKGGSAKLIREVTQKPLHLFDTFEGLPELSPNDDPKSFKSGDCYATLDGVQSYLKGYVNVHFYKGLFPQTADPIRDIRFSFVHFDVDMYESTKSCLEFFYPRMSPGGAIISHDYPGYIGVKKAFDEFFADKPEIIIETFGTGQALVIKV